MNEDATGFDAGPLNWLWPEFEQALGAVAAALPDAGAIPDEAALAAARDHLHRVGGALRMVGLAAVVPYVDAMEHAVALLSGRAGGDTASTRGVIERAIRALAAFLNEVRLGAPVVALKLFPQYAMLQRQHGIEAPNPVDLFRPDLDAEVPWPAAEPSTAARVDLSQQRRAFQAGLLAWLRGDGSGVLAMRGAIAAIDAVTTDRGQHAFWWIVAAWLDAVAMGGIATDIGSKQLAGRIDAQIRRLLEGSPHVPERLRCEVLYQIARSETLAPSVRAVQRTYGLADLIPARGVEFAAVDVEPVLRHEALLIARAVIARAKEAWPACATANASARSQVNQALGVVKDQALAVGDSALARLVAAFADRLLAQADAKMPDSLLLEGATCLLFIEAGLADDAAYAPDAAVRVDAMLARLDAVAANLPLAAAVPPQPRQPIARQPRERVLVARVAHEVRINLGRIEAALDDLFRDSAPQGGLPELATAFKQAQGALHMLGLGEAAAQLARCAEEVDRDLSGERLDEAQRSRLAETLSRLDLYLQLIEQQRPGADRLLSELQLIAASPSAPETVAPAIAAIETLVDLRFAGGDARTLAARIDELGRRVDALRTRADEHSLIKDAKLAQSMVSDVGGIIDLAAALRDSIADLAKARTDS